MSASERSWSTAPIRLTQVVYALSIGGSESLARDLVRALNHAGRFRCSIYAVDHGGPLAEELAADGIPCTAFGRRGRLDARVLVRLALRFRATHTRLVHTHHLGQLLYGGMAARLAGARVVHTEHEYYSFAKVRSRRLLRVLSALVHRVTAVAEPVAAFLRDTVGIPSAKVATIPNGVDVERFASAKPIARHQLGCGDRDVIIGCVGRLSPEKGQAVLLEGFHHLSRRHPEVRLLLVGDGNERPRLTMLADELGLQDRVRFLGMRSDVPGLLAACDVVALPSLQEGFPMVLLEALAARKAVVATNVGAVSQVVAHGETGLLVPPGTARTLAEALGYLVEEPTLRDRLGARGADMVRERFDFQETVTRYQQVYEAVLASRW